MRRVVVSHAEKLAIIDHVPILRGKTRWRNAHQRRMWTAMGLDVLAAAEALGYVLVPPAEADGWCPRCGGPLDTAELFSDGGGVTAVHHYCRSAACGGSG